MQLYVRREPDPLRGIGVARALLERAAHTGTASVALWRPLRPALSLGRLDTRDPRAREVAALAREAGVTVVSRLSGGRAATFDGGCLCLGWAQPQAGLGGSSERYQLTADLIIAALRQLGVDAYVGEVPGEWCPGAWSVQSPAGKLAGLAQRQIKGGAWCEALIVLERPPSLRLLSRRVHELLEIPWSEEAQGELAAALPDQIDLHDRLSEAIIHELRRRWPSLQQAPLPEAVSRRALQLAPEHRWP